MIKTRFAPSPTGLLHLGGARTALFSWLLARAQQGKFVLRIEDTDLERSTPESVQAILDGMSWLGLDFDEGPFYQTQRFARYSEIIDGLLQQGDAYHCECSKDRLEKLREQQMSDKQKPRYDGRCRELGLSASSDQSRVVRFKNPQSGQVDFIDQVKGQISVCNAELDDLIIARSDGSPTYNLSVVVDDMDMGITQVLRGDDHVNNTPRQINILKALGASVPGYAHVPMILGDDGKRLSKRHGAVGVMQYQQAGYLPDALLNYLVRLGWSHGDQEIFSRAEMIELFSLSGLNKAPSSFNTEKLNWINQQAMMASPLDQIVALVRNRLSEIGVDYDPQKNIDNLVDLYRQRSNTINQLVDSIGYCFQEFDVYDEKAARKALTAQAVEPLSALHQNFEKLNDWNASSIQQAILAVTETLELGMGKVGQPLRVAITGGSFSPPIDQTAELLGQQRCLRRIKAALDYISGLT